jgi:arginine exporter protein ArgO
MKKAMKTILTLGGVAFAGYYAYKQYRKFSQSEEMNKTLHAFLKKIYGEEPVL